MAQDYLEHLNRDDNTLVTDERLQFSYNSPQLKFKGMLYGLTFSIGLTNKVFELAHAHHYISQSTSRVREVQRRWLGLPRP